MPNFESITELMPVWGISSVMVLIALVAMLIAKSIILVRLQRWSNAKQTQIHSLLLGAINRPLTFLILSLSVVLYRLIYTSLSMGDMPMETHFTLAAQILLIIALVLFADRFSVGLIGSYAERSNTFRGSRSIFQGITHGIVFGIGGLILLGTLGISITPLIASLGITSLAVALALQPTLENFFSGVQLVVDKPIRVGDFIELDSGEQGFVEKIGWRSTWIKMLPNNTVIMPNSLLSQSKIINYFYPEKELSVPVEVGVHYSSDLEHVEQVTLEVAREILSSHKWGVPEYETFVVYTGFGDSSVNFTVMLRAREYFNRFWVKSAFIKALHKRFAEEGITIPYPIRAINLEQEGAGSGHLRHTDTSSVVQTSKERAPMKASCD